MSHNTAKVHQRRSRGRFANHVLCQTVRLALLLLLQQQIVLSNAAPHLASIFHWRQQLWSRLVLLQQRKRLGTILSPPWKAKPTISARKQLGHVAPYSSQLESPPSSQSGPLRTDHKDMAGDDDTEDLFADSTASNSLVSSRASQRHRRPSLNNWAPNLAHAVQSLDQRSVARTLASGLQIGLILYLAHAVWKAVAEVMDEFVAETTGDSVAKSSDQITKAILYVEESHNSRAAEVRNHRPDTTNIPTLAPLALKLWQSGLPLRSETTEASVESVLSRLTKQEAAMLQQCLWAPPPFNDENEDASPVEMLHQVWSQVIGLMPVKERLLSSLKHLKLGSQPHAYSSLFDDSTGGILLYGPPGCGKTMLVRALATTARVPCLVLTPSAFFRKYVGETNAQVRTLFSLAHKLAPAIVCIDELDGLFRERNENDHEASRDLKTEFLQWWDGLLTSHVPILVIGATNRPFDVDAAVLRRMPQSHHVGLPDVTTRAMLLKNLLKQVPTDPNLDIRRIAIRTETYSPSDMRQVLQTAALMGPMKEHVHSNDSTDPHRPLTTDDIITALQTTPPTPMSASYRQALSNFARQQQQQHPAVGDEQKWETDWGNFYDVGTLQVDASVFDALSDLVRHLDDEARRRDGDDDDWD